MSTTIARSVVVLLLVVLNRSAGADSIPELSGLIARSFAGTYRFNYLFSEDGALYVDVAAHGQLLELDVVNGAPRITFFNQNARGEKRSHYSYVFRQTDNKITLREFDGNGKFRFDCVGTFDPAKKTFDCKAPGAPKPARDTDSPITRKSGLFKRPTSWPPYDTLDRHNVFRFYDWGFVNIQANLKVGADGRIVAREAGVVTAVKAQP